MQTDTSRRVTRSGTVAFLFTDMEGSTQLLRRLGARAYAGVLAEHDRVLRAAIADGGGEVVDTQGDAVFAAFPDVTRAVGAAVAAQRDLQDWRAPEGELVRVRMGLHCGVPEVAEGRYLGLDVHLAARICAAAHGGQTVVSTAIADRLGEAQPDIALTDLGDHTLKDFDHPQRLYQVDSGGTHEAFPPLRTTGATGDVERFQGREEELAEAARTAIARAARRSERRRLLVAFAAVAAIAAGVAAYIAARPTPIHVAPDSVGIIDAQSGKVRADVPIGPAPASITSGAGAVWVLDTAKDTLTRIDPVTHRSQTQGVGGLTSRPTDVALQDGKIWLVNGYQRTASILSVARGGSLIQTVPLSGNLGVLGTGDAHAVSNPSGVWVANGGTGGVSLFNPHSNHRITTIGTASGRLAVGYGAVWLIAGYGPFGASGQIIRIGEANRHKEKSIPVGEADDVATGSGAVWVADATAGTIARINPRTNTVTRTIPVAGGAQVVAAGDGYVFAAGPTGIVSRIDPAKNAVVGVTRLGGVRPVSVAVYHGGVYVGVEPPRPTLRPVIGLRVVAPPGAIDSVDPAFAYFATSWQLLYATGLNLVTYPDRAGKPGTRLVPDAAVAMPRVSNHGHTYTFTVRRGFHFSPPSGRKVTAADFRTAIERDLRIGEQSPDYQFLPDIVGAAAFAAGKPQHPKGIVVHGRRISIKVISHGGLLLPTLALPMFAAVPPNTPQSTGGLSFVPSAGPYYIRFYAPNHELILAKNPNYHGPRHATWNAITYQERPGYNWQTVIDGHADYGVGLPTPPPAALARYGPTSTAARAGHQQIFVAGDQSSVAFFAMNTHRTLFRSPLARQAINEAIDRRALAATLGPGALVTDQYLPPSIGDRIHRRIYPLAHPNLPQARRLLRRAGIHTPITATLYTCSIDAPVCAARARILATDLQPLGIHLRVRRFSRAVEFHNDTTPPEAPFDLADEGFTYAINSPAFFFLTAGFAYLDTGPYTRPIQHAADLPYAKSRSPLARLSYELARNYAPLAAYGTDPLAEPFSARVSCQVVQPYFGIDLTHLCRR